MTTRTRTLATSLILVTLAVIAVELAAVLTTPISGTHNYERYRQTWWGGYTQLDVRRTRTLNVLGSVAWMEVSDNYYNPPTTTGGGNSISSMKTTITGTRYLSTYTLSPAITISTSFTGVNPPPSTIREAYAIVPTGIGATVGSATKYLPDDHGEIWKNVWNIPSVTLRCNNSPDNVPQPFNVRVTLQNEDTGEVRYQQHSIDYSGLTFTITSPGAGLWSIINMNYFR